MKKLFCSLCLLLFTFTLSGCVPYIGFYRDLREDISEEIRESIISPIREAREKGSSMLHDILLDAMGCDEDGFMPDTALLKVESLTTDDAYTITDSDTLSKYTKTLSAVTAHGIFSQINHNSTSLPNTAKELYSYTLWSSYDSDHTEKEQDFACRSILYEEDGDYYMKVEYRDARIEDSPYYLIITEGEEEYFLDICRE